MVSAERDVKSGILASLDLPHMRGVKEALARQATGKYGEAGLKGLEGAVPEDQRAVVKAALDEARAGYLKLGNHDKVPLVGKVEEAYDQGLLTLSDLLQGLGLKAPDNNKGGVLGGLRKFLGR